MFCPPPTDDPSTGMPRLPLAVSTVAVALTLSVTACDALPNSTPGAPTDDQAQPPETCDEEGCVEEENDPTDAEASVRAAADNVEAAESYHATTFRVPEGGGDFSTRIARFTYTEDPEPALHHHESNEGSAGTHLYRAADGTVLISRYDGPAEVVEEPTRPDSYRADFGLAGAKIEEILATSPDLGHNGAEDITVETVVEAEDDSGYEHLEETVSTHRYSGTFTSQHVEFTTELGPELSEYEDATFTLWIDEDGYPVQLEHVSGGDTETLTYERFNEPEAFVVPGPGEYPVPSLS